MSRLQVVCYAPTKAASREDKEAFLVMGRASEAWLEKGGVEEKWLAVHFALASAAEDVLGITTHHQPD